MSIPRSGFLPQLHPFAKGETVLIPKGTLVDGVPAKRSQKVVVHHLGCGSSLYVGRLRPGQDTPILGVGDRDKVVVERIYGTEDLTKLWNEGKMELSCVSSAYSDIFLPLSEPTVVWPGAGGKWRSASIHDVKKV